MTTKIRLKEEQIKLLESQPEQGMGFQIIDIIFKNGKTLTKRIVFNSTFLKIDPNEVIDPNEIELIKLHDS